MIAREGTPIVAVWRGAVVRLSEKRQVRAAARVDEGGRFAIGVMTGDQKTQRPMIAKRDER